MANRKIERGRGGRDRTREAIVNRAAAFALVGSEEDSRLDGLLLDVAEEGSRQLASHRRVRFRQEPSAEDNYRVVGETIADVLRARPGLLAEMRRPSDAIIEALGGVVAYYQLLEEVIDMEVDSP